MTVFNAKQKDRTMNAATVTAELASHIDDQFKVVSFKPAEPESELDRVAKTHRVGVIKYEQRISDTKLAMKGDLAKLEADRKAEKERHEAEMAILAERIAETRSKAEKDMAADRKLLASCKAAIAELVRE